MKWCTCRPSTRDSEATGSLVTVLGLDGPQKVEVKEMESGWPGTMTFIVA